MRQCPKCYGHYEHIFTIEISPTTHQRWRVERCPRCDYNYDLELEREYNTRKNSETDADKRRQFRDDRGKWQFGL
jgi:hypothetical protein